MAPLLRGQIESIGTAPHFKAFDKSRALIADEAWRDSAQNLPGRLLAWIDDRLGGESLLAAGHRIVHGGEEFVAPVRLDDRALAKLSRLSPLAPLHQPHNLAAVAAVAKARPGLLQVGCFDTAFHHTMTAPARSFGLPHAFEQEGIRRFGFHGLSFEYIAGRLKALAPEAAGGRILVAHLGAGSSLCALKGGVSLDTTMSLTPLDGLLMGTRPGSLDPGLLLYLMQARKMDASQLEDLLYHRSGLLGVSGISDDMRVLLESAEEGARRAIALFVFRVQREIGALAAILGGLDGVVFTGGIGENSAEIRERIAAGMDWLGLRLDTQANRTGKMEIGAANGAVRAWVIATDEESVIARHTLAVARLTP
jgi:acetate kinase